MSFATKKLQHYTSTYQEPTYTLFPCKHKVSADKVINRIFELSLEKEKQDFLCFTCKQNVTIIKMEKHQVILSSCLTDGTPITEQQAEQRDVIDALLTIGQELPHLNEPKKYIPPTSTNVFTFSGSNCSQAVKNLQKK